MSKQIEERRVIALETIAEALSKDRPAPPVVKEEKKEPDWGPIGSQIAAMDRNTKSNLVLAAAVRELAALANGTGPTEVPTEGTLSGSTLGEETSAESAEIDAEELTQELQDAKKGSAD